VVALEDGVVVVDEEVADSVIDIETPVACPLK